MLESASQVWKHFVATGGVKSASWDAPLVESLRSTLSLGPGPIEDELAAAGVSIEDLVTALLGELSPFTAMMGELLALFESQGIRRSDGSAEIAFDFGGAGQESLAFDLESFRRMQWEWVQATVVDVDLSWLRTNSWNLAGVLRGAIGDFDWQQSRSSTASWLESYQAGAWPEPRLEVPPSGSPSLDTELSRLAAIWAAVVRAVRERSDGREKLRAAAYASDETTPARELWLLESDYFLLTFANAISAVANGAERLRTPTRWLPRYANFSKSIHSVTRTPRAWCSACSTFSTCRSGSAGMSCTPPGSWSRYSRRLRVARG